MHRLLCVVALTSACVADLPSRTCLSDGECLQAGAPGTCLPSPLSSERFCVFPSLRCSGGSWGVLSGDGLAGACYLGKVAPADAPVDGAGAAARLTLTPDDADFGTVVAGMSSPDATFTLTNAGTGTSGSIAVTTGGRDADDFVVLSDLCSNTALSSGGMCTIKVRFRPTMTGAKSATVGVSAIPGGIVLATMGGTSARASSLAVNPALADFGATLEGTRGSEATFTVRNTAETQTAVSAALGHGTDFAITTNGCTGTLAGLASCTIKVQLQPRGATAVSDSLIVSDGVGGATVAQLTGRGLGSAALVLLPASHDFGSVSIGGQTAATVFTLTNAGGVASGVPSVQLSSPEFVLDANGCTAALPPEGTCTVGVRFMAGAPEGAKAATLTVGADPGGQTTAALAGMALGQGDVTVAPAIQDFGAVAIGGHSAEVQYAVTNGGAGAVVLLAPAVSGNDPASFGVGSNDCPAMLASGTSCHVGVSFAPLSVGAKSASLTVGGSAAALSGTGTAALTVVKAGTGTGTVTSAPAGINCGATCVASLSVDSVTLSATPGPQSDLTSWSGGGCSGTGSCIVTLEAAKTVTATFALKPATLALTPASQDFGAVILGSLSAAIDFTVVNNGGAASGALAAMVSDASYTITGATCLGTTLAAGASCKLTVRFAPTGQSGSRPATLTVTAGPGISATSSLTGSALAPGALTLSPASKDFGSVAVGGMSAETAFTVTNTGQSDTGTLAANLSDSASFAISSSTCPAVLAAGASCSVGVRFTPVSVGAKTGASLTVSAAPGGNASSSLQGTANAQVTVTNAGGGSVTSTPAGITCGATCSATFTAGPVTLSAAPDGTHTFGGWTGACTGTGDCVLGLGAGTNAVTATFTVIPGSLTLSPSSQDFGSVTLGAVSSVDFTVKNTGGATSSSISAMVSDAASYTVTGGTCINAQLAAGATCTVTVRFNPTGQAGAKPATLTVSATQGGSPTSSLTGTALSAGALAFSPTSKDFGSVAVGGMSGETLFTLMNTGQSTTGTLGAPMLSDIVDFMVSSNTCPSTLGPSASCMIGVKLTPASVGAKTGVSLTVSGAGTASASLQGTGTAQVTVTNAGGGTVTSSPPGITCGTTCNATFSSGPVTLTAAPDGTHTFSGWTGACSGTGDCVLGLGTAMNAVTATFALMPANLTVSPSTKDFTSVNIGSTSTATTFTVMNTGAASSGTIAASVDDTTNYTVTGGTCMGMQLGVGGTCTVMMQFNPAAPAGSKPATLTVTGTPGGSPTAALTGMAVATAVLTLSPSSKDFGQVALGSMSSEMLLTLMNTGQATSGTLTTMLSDTTNFTVSSNTCPATLGVGASCSVGVKFTALSLGAKTGVTLVVSADPGGNTSSTLQGTGTAQVAVTNAGGGTVTSSPPGINCGSTCNKTFSSAPVSLTATADNVHAFSGWGGACSGTGSCSLPITSATNNVTATFSCPVQSLTFTSVSGASGTQMLGVWGSGASDVWAVGASGKILHWTGGPWTSVTSGTSATLNAVWGSGANDVWAVGTSGTILHWLGSAWAPVTSGTSVSLLAVWGSSASDVWAVGTSGTVLHWTGTAWGSVGSPATNTLHAIWGSSASNVWADGSDAFFIRWTGNSWSTVSGIPTTSLVDIWGTGASDVWTVGSFAEVGHWNGSSWSFSKQGDGATTLFSVWGSASSDVWVVGGSGTILHWNGSAWACASSPTSQGFNHIWGSGPSDVWLVGNSGTIVHGQ